MSKKLINWSTPKAVQQREKKSASTSMPSKVNRSTAKWCKKLKGAHNYSEIDGKRKWFWWTPECGFHLFVCSGCGRHDVRYDPDLYERPFWRDDN